MEETSGGRPGITPPGWTDQRSMLHVRTPTPARGPSSSAQLCFPVYPLLLPPAPPVIS